MKRALRLVLLLIVGMATILIVHNLSVRFFDHSWALNNLPN